MPGGASSLRGDFPADMWAVLAMMIQAGRVANLQQVSCRKPYVPCGPCHGGLVYELLPSSTRSLNHTISAMTV